jgi:L-rhamnonate dehydratase
MLATTSAASGIVPPLVFAGEGSGLKITAARLVEVKPRQAPLPYRTVHEKWAGKDIPTSRPLDLYFPGKPSGLGSMDTFDPARIFYPAGGFDVEITTDKGLTGLGRGGLQGASAIQYFAPLITGQDPFEVEKIWDIMWRGSLHFGRAGMALFAISAIDLALWDLIGKAAGMPVYKLLGGRTKPRIPAYATLNEVQHHVQFGFRRNKLAVPYGPPAGRDGLKKNGALVRHARDVLGPDGDIMLDCWMSLDEEYTIELARMVEPHRVYWIEEPLPPDDYEGYGRLRAAIKSTRITTGEHEYTRYGFRRLAEKNCAAIWQPDIHWCGGMTELRRIASIAAAYDIPVIPHLGGLSPFARHFIAATPNSPWAEFMMPPPGGPPEVYKWFEEDNLLSRGPEGVYTEPSDKPGFGWDVTLS